jgi:alginate O-acetyltransferase complex protein AlgI
VLIADNLAGFATPVFNQQADTPTLFTAWGGALAYTFQLYFDFSGYSDMAIGLSRIFGVRLPLNFSSPYKSRNIADFWRRWHMTLSRFLRDYLYIPLGGNRQGSFRRQTNLMTTMVLGGLWHGAGWNFVVWGGLHGCFLVVNQGWQTLSQRFQLRLPGRLGHFLGVAITFFCVVLAWVYFRAPDITTANRIITGMLGGAGAEVPAAIANHMGLFKPLFETLNISIYLGGGSNFVETWGWISIGAVIAFVAPNTQEIMVRFEQALQTDRQQSELPRVGLLSWAPQKRHAIAIGLLLAFGMLALSRPTEFLYFQF